MPEFRQVGEPYRTPQLELFRFAGAVSHLSVSIWEHGISEEA